MNPAIEQEYTILDFKPILRYCYLYSVPHGGVLEQDIEAERLPLCAVMVKQGLLSITVRPDDKKVYCITKKGAVLLPAPDLFQCVASTATEWLKVREETNIRPIFHGPFHSRVK